MGNLNKYDARVDSLVMETRTFWDPETAKLKPEDKEWLAHAVHLAPAKATKVQYERSHTGFTREITVTAADVERLYNEKFAG